MSTKNLVSELSSIIASLDLPLKDKDIHKLVADNIHLFISSFTSDLKNQNEDKNYQVAEKYGDAMLSICFEYILIRDKKIKVPSIITNLEANLCSSIIQPELAEKLGLHRFIDTSAYSGDLRKVKEDVFEAFLGSLSIAIENTFGLEYVFPFMIQVIRTIYSFLNESNIAIYSQKNPKQALKEAFEAVRMGLPYFVRKKEVDGTTTIHIYRKVGNSEDLKAVCSVNGKGEMDTYIEAVEKAMNTIGVTNDMIEEQRKNKNMNPDIKRLEEEINSVLSPLGYSNVKYKIEKSRRSTSRLWIYVEDIKSGEKYYIMNADVDKNVSDISISDGKIYQGCLEVLLESLRKKRNKDNIVNYIISEAERNKLDIEDVMNEDQEASSENVASTIRERRESNRYLDTHTVNKEEGKDPKPKVSYKNTRDEEEHFRGYSRGRSTNKTSFRGYRRGYRDPRTPLE